MLKNTHTQNKNKKQKTKNRLLTMAALSWLAFGVIVFADF
jgi:hypothetical protein